MPSESTLKQYQSRIKILTDAKIDLADPLQWFEDTKQGLSSQKLYLSAIKWYMTENKQEFPKSLQDKINELYKKQNEKAEKQELTEKQEKQFVEWSKVIEASKKLAEKQEKTDNEWREHLILSLYTLNPPVRADYGEVQVFPKRNKKRTTGNELIWRKNKPVFVFRDYKTAKTYGEVELPVSKPLQKVIASWFAHLGKTPKYLLGKYVANKYDPDQPSNPLALSHSVQEIMKKHTGRDAGISLLRHAYITHTFPDLKTIQAKNDLSRRMLHSKTLQEQYNLPAKS